MLHTTTYVSDTQVRDSGRTIYIPGEHSKQAVDHLRREGSKFKTSANNLQLFLSVILASLTVGYIVSGFTSEDVAIWGFAAIWATGLIIALRLYVESVEFARAERRLEAADVSGIEVLSYSDYLSRSNPLRSALRRRDRLTENSDDSPYDQWLYNELLGHTELGKQIAEVLETFWEEHGEAIELSRAAPSGYKVLQVLDGPIRIAAKKIHTLLLDREEPSYVTELREKNKHKRLIREAEQAEAQFKIDELLKQFTS